MKKRDEWKAVRRGSIYCAPRCGGGCTWEAHLAAKRAGAILARVLGKGWKARIWENLGWHYEAFHPVGIKVSEYFHGAKFLYYHASTDDRIMPQHRAEGSSAREAVANLLRSVQATARQAKRASAAIEGALAK